MLDAELLAELEAVLAQQSGELLAKMPSGVARADIVAAFDRAGLAASDEAVQWWGWRDGSSLQILPGLEHMSLAEALEGRRVLRELAARDLAIGSPEIPVNRWWSTGWVLIFGTGGLSKLALDCEGAPEEPSPLRQVDWDGIGEDSYALAFAGSLGEYVERAVRCLRDGRYRYDGAHDTWLPLDWARKSAAQRF